MHVATDQFEPIRVVSNIIVAAGAVTILFVPRLARPLGLAAGLSYLLLNVVFLAQHGMTNPTTEALRLPLFVFVALTLVLLAWCGARTPKKPSE